MSKPVIALYLVLIPANLMFWFTIGAAFNLFVAGIMIGVGYITVLDWWFDRKLNKEIMEEINALSRNYDTQMSLWDQPTFSENQENK